MKSDLQLRMECGRRALQLPYNGYSKDAEPSCESNAFWFRLSGLGFESDLGARPSDLFRQFTTRSPLPAPLQICFQLFLWMMLAASPLAVGQTLSDATLQSIRFDQNLNAQVTSTLPFLDETGQTVRLGQYFGSKPVVLILGYYRCPMLCTLVLNGFLESAADMKWSIGHDFEVVDVSIDPRETPALASSKKRNMVKRYGRPDAGQGWHFLTGSEPAIAQLCQQVGFHYAYDPVSKQYAHPSGLIMLTPEGKVSGYLFGVTFASKELYESVRRASTHQVGSPIEQFILLCFHYNPITGKYSNTIMSCLRWFSVLTLLGMAAFFFRLTRPGPPLVEARGDKPSPESDLSPACDHSSSP